MSQNFEDFTAALAKGSGRSVLIMRQAANPRSFEDAVVHACLHDLAYDPQCEHERSEYLARLIVETGDETGLFGRLVAQIKDQEVDAPLLFTVLARLAAKNGDFEKSAVQRAYLDLDPEAQLDCLDALVRLVGMPAFIEGAARIDADLEGEGWRAGGLLDALKDHDEATFDQSVGAARAEHPSVERLMAQYEASNQPTRVADGSYDLPAILAELRQGKRLRGVIFKDLSSDDWQLICEDFLAQDREEVALPYLTLFGRRPFTGNPVELVRWTKSSNSRVVWAATRALGRMESAVVREMALEQIRAGRPSGARLLASNYRSGDLAMILPMLRDLPDNDEVHDLGLAILNLTGENDVSAEDSADVLLLLYERTPCSMCRADVVSRLFKAQRVPDWMADECRFDSDPEAVERPDGVDAGSYGRRGHHHAHRDCRPVAAGGLTR
ncbi:hypothetical protein [Phenylobacterium sp.]|uniref:hypothetical protein n=1 Tax=Phenylobacterium sp. TaxID=1871053 RepID=UPI0025D307FD|nr:hypothetical protein [Phenylobacterium sp.]